MISLKKYLDATQPGGSRNDEPEQSDLLPAVVSAYGSALQEIGHCSVEACPALGGNLKQSLDGLSSGLANPLSLETVTATEAETRQHLRVWGRATAKHYEEKTAEVKELLLAMAGAAEAVSVRDTRCAGQMSAVTQRLQAIASLEDLTEIRASVMNSAAELKVSIDRMAAEGKAAMDQLHQRLIRYKTKLEEAEEQASRDALTGLSSRLYVEGQIVKWLAAGTPMCVAILDIDCFKKVNDEQGHLAGDELLKQFSTELRAACRRTDLIGRWGGDEFILLFDCALTEAKAQVTRLREWICGEYTLRGRSGEIKLIVNASIGLAERNANDGLKELIERADAAMYKEKAIARTKKPLIARSVA